MSTETTTSGCPSDDGLLVRLVEGELAQDSQAELESHISGCEHCASVIGDLGAIGFAKHAAPDHRLLVPVDPQHYVLAEEIARGGMGRILRARDRRLGREVAIKEIFGKTGDAARRFEREARITARLQHPAIVHVHEAGTWPNGEPFFAMPLIAGRSLDRVIADAATLDRRFALVPNALAVADAIAYAHSKGVIHRDLKPKNVLVGDFGETIVIDWGLAKDMSAAEPAVDDGPYRAACGPDHQTKLGTVVGTAAYMPPEQARGEAVDQRADVYALGALLFHVLAGRQPVTGRDSEDALAKIIDGRVPSLADVQPGVPRDLLAIVDKAMARSPDDRYASARELADDLRQFQTGQLVSAHHYSTRQLMGRWLRRHRTPVIVAAAASVVLAAVGLASVRSVVRAEHVAQSERVAAEQHRANAEDLMSFMLTDLRAKLEPIGKLDLLDTVATKATRYYDHQPLADDDTASSSGGAAGHDVTDARQRAIALDNLGEVLLARGHTAEALAQYRIAFGITEVFAVSDPSSRSWRRDLSVRHSSIGTALAAQGDTAGALAEYRAALGIDTTLVAADPNNAAQQRDLSVDHEKVADMLQARAQYADALAEYHASLAISEQLAARAPGGGAERDASVGHERVGEALTLIGDADAALVEHRAALAIRLRLVARDPSNATWQRDLAGSHHAVGELLAARADVTGALAEFRAAHAIDELLAARDPSNTDWQSDLAFSHDNLGKTLAAQGDPVAALAEFRAALPIQERLASQDPTHADRLRDVELTHKGIARALVVQGHRPEALAEIRIAIDLAGKLAPRDPANADWQRDLALGHELAGQILADTGDATGALSEYRECLAIRTTLLARDPSNADWQNDVAAAHYNLGDVLAKRDPAAALIEHRAALAVTAALVARNPGNTARQHDLAESHEQVAKLELATGQLAGAHADLQAARTIVERLAAVEPKNARWQDELAALRRDHVP